MSLASLILWVITAIGLLNAKIIVANSSSHGTSIPNACWLVTRSRIAPMIGLGRLGVMGRF